MGRVVTNPTGSVVDASEVKILYESNENTNAYTDGDKASLGEVKDAIDMAKKVIEITFLLNDWTSNSDGTYSQTVNNSEIKSSMNPDLISMLSSGATPEEQKTYMKNFSILCQGVGNTANGSVTYKIYKQMTGDITVGLTRLGGVKQIESGAKVDDVKVDGVSVVKDKVAEIPAIPTNLDFVPYKNAQRDIELGDKILSAGISITEDGVTTGYNTRLYPQSISVGASIKKSGELFPSDEKNVELKPDGMIFTGNTPNSSSITVTPEYSKDEDFDHLAFIVKNYKLQQGFAKLKVGEPTEDSQAATKKYVDEAISAIPEVDTSKLVPYTGATKDVDLNQHKIKAGDLLRLGTDSTNVYLSTNGIAVNGTTTPFCFRLNADNNNFAFYGNNAKPISPVIGEPTADNQATTKKYVDSKVAEVSGKEIKTALVSETLNHLAPGSPWAEFDFNQGDFVGIPFNDLLGYNVWALYESTPQGFSIATTAEIKTVPLQEDNGKFSGLRIAYKSTKSTADTYTVFAIVTYRK